MRTTLTLGAIAAANLVSNFFIQWTFLTLAGPGRTSDAFFAASTIPQFITATVAATLMNVLVPLLVQLKEGELERVGTILTLLHLAALSVIFGVLWLSAPLWIDAIFIGFDRELVQLTVTLARIQLLTIIFSGLHTVLWSVDHARHRYVWSEATPLIGSVAALVLLPVAWRHYGVAGVSALLVARAAVQGLLLMTALRGFARGAWPAETGTLLWTRMRPVLAANAYYKSGVILDRLLASRAPAGGLSLLNIAQQSWGAGLAVFNTAVVAPLTASLSTAIRTGSRAAHDRELRRSAIGGMLVSAAAVAVTAAAGLQIMTAFAGRSFRPADLTLLWMLLIAMGGYAVAGSAGQSLAAAFYARGDTRTPARIGMAGFTFSIVAKIVAFQRFGVVGIAAAMSLHQLFNTLLLYGIFMRRRSRDAGNHDASPPIQ